MMLTSKEKRQRIISNALYAYMRNDTDFFALVRDKIVKLIQGKSPEDRDKIILKWIQECESLAAPIVKDEIQKHFTQ